MWENKANRRIHRVSPQNRKGFLKKTPKYNSKGKKLMDLSISKGRIFNEGHYEQKQFVKKKHSIWEAQWSEVQKNELCLQPYLEYMFTHLVGCSFIHSQL